MKGLSPLIEGVLAIGITLTIAVLVGNFLMHTAQNSSSTVANSTGERINCVYANFYIKNATFDAGGDCTAGVNHGIIIDVRNSGQVGLNIDNIAVESTSGKMVNYQINEMLSTGEMRTLEGTSSDSCLDFVAQNETSGYVNRISRIFATSKTCSLSNEVGPNYISCSGCDQSELEPNTYLAGLWHFNSTLMDSSINGNDGTFVNGSPQYSSGKFGNAIDFNGTDYVEINMSGSKETVILWYKNATDGIWTFLADSMGTTYVNGVEQAPVVYPIYVSSTTVRIGRTILSEYFNGTIDEVAIYNRAFSKEEIIDDYVKGTK